MSEWMLNVLVVYEDIRTGKRAKETCDALARNLGQNWSLKIDLWSFTEMQSAGAASSGQCEVPHQGMIFLRLRSIIAIGNEPSGVAIL
jgi:hypothetical protein